VKRNSVLLDEKSSLVSGFDSSTENRTFFKLSGDKILFAPFLVKNDCCWVEAAFFDFQGGCRSGAYNPFSLQTPGELVGSWEELRVYLETVAMQSV